MKLHCCICVHHVIVCRPTSILDSMDNDMIPYLNYVGDLYRDTYHSAESPRLNLLSYLVESIVMKCKCPGSKPTLIDL